MCVQSGSRAAGYCAPSPGSNLEVYILKVSPSLCKLLQLLAQGMPPGLAAFQTFSRLNDLDS